MGFNKYGLTYRENNGNLTFMKGNQDIYVINGKKKKPLIIKRENIQLNKLGYTYLPTETFTQETRPIGNMNILSENKL